MGVLKGLFGGGGKPSMRHMRVAAGDSERLQREMHDKAQGYLDPYRDAGTGALEGLAGMAGPAQAREFSQADFESDPGYQFRMQEGQKALERSAAARGGALGGRALKDLSRFGQGLASQEYQNAFNRFQQQEGNRLNQENLGYNANQQRLMGLAGMGMGAAGQGAGMATNLGQSISDIKMGLSNARTSMDVAHSNQQNQMIGNLVGAGAMLFSDERLKTNKKPVSKEDIEEFRKSIKPYWFDYKDSEFGEGQWVGVMAQDLEKSKIGRLAVFEDECGNKKIDFSKLNSVILASVAEGVV